MKLPTNFDGIEKTLETATTAECLRLAAHIKTAAWNTTPEVVQHYWEMCLKAAAPDDRVEAFRTEAGAHGDQQGAQSAERALAGDYVARRDVAACLADAEAADC